MSNKLVKNSVTVDKKSNKSNDYMGYIVIGVLLVITVVIIAIAANGGINLKGKDNSGSTSFDASDWKKNEKIQKKIDAKEQLKGKHHVEIAVKDYGVIKAELYGDDAPISVTNFIKLANSGFYNGLTFHRIISGFMIQGGDPKHDGTGGSEENIKGEFINNGVNNTLLHTRGAISMARSMDNDSASSQFFIVHETSEHLDKQYAVFGYVTEGMDIVDKICKNVPTTDSNGTVTFDHQPVINYVKVID